MQQHRRGSGNVTRDLGSANQRSGQAVHWQGVVARQFQVRHKASISQSSEP
ncbi:Unknown protein sequence [Pseudomonas amygdali pv. sesami]|nr:Unknown protein sequence [Pseudomonas amygdali pv. sesami]